MRKTDIKEDPLTIDVPENSIVRADASYRESLILDIDFACSFQ